MGHFKQVLLLLASLLLEHSLSFVVPQQRTKSALVMDMSAGGNKKRRRRKEAPTGATALDPIKLEKESLEGNYERNDDDGQNAMEEVTQFELKPDDIAKGKSSVVVCRAQKVLQWVAHGIIRYNEKRRIDGLLARNRRSGKV